MRKPFRISIRLETPDGYYQQSAGIDDNFEVAFDKAVSEFAERYWGSDVAPNEDKRGLVEYKTRPRKWCSTGMAAHADLEKSLHKSRAELIERDTVAAWMATGVPALVVRKFSDSFFLVRPPCRFRGWHVVACVRLYRPENGELRTLISGGCDTDFESACEMARYESHLRPEQLPEDFANSRLPYLPFRPHDGSPFQEGVDELDDTPELDTRVWRWRDRVITKIWSPHLSDFHRGLQDHTYERYVSFLGGGSWPRRQLQKRWYF